MGQLILNIRSLLCCILIFVMMSFPVVESEVDKYHAEVRIFVEPSALNKWRSYSGKSSYDDFKTEMSAYFIEVNNRYKSLKEFNQVKITFEIESFTALKNNLLWNPNVRLISTKSLDLFKNHISQSWDDKPYDMAILLTGFHIKQGTTLGYAYIKSVCTQTAVGIISIEPGQRLVTIFAHEIGHIFGAEHDADDYSDLPCYKDNGRIMNPSAKHGAAGRFQFSICSSNYFYQMKYHKRACLKNGNGTITGQRLGDLVKPDDYCERDSLKGGFVPRPFYYRYSYDRICESVQCADNGGTPRTTIFTMQGLKCGKNKVCNRGVCEESFEGSPFILDSCPLGDQPRVGGNLKKSCRDIDPADCHKYEDVCCFTCNKNNPVFNMTADDVCRQLDGEKSVMLRSSNSQGDQLCSQLKCTVGEKGKQFKTILHVAPDGMACGKNKRCAGGKCEVTKHGNPNIPDSCPFGDQDLKALGYKGTCEKYSVKGCKRWKQSCCQSCKGK